MAINNKNKSYKENSDNWDLIDNITCGKDVEQYLVTLNPKDKSLENEERNSQYQERAVFYDIAGYTLKGLCSLPFNYPVNVELPDLLEYMISNVDGSGTDLNQQAKEVLSETIKKGRCGLFVTFPKTDKVLSKADLEYNFSTINYIEAKQIINWSTRTIGSVTLIDLVVVEDIVTEVEDYVEKEVKQITELYLDESNIYNVRTWRENEDKDDEWYIFDESIPRQSNGQYFNKIPFVFIGSEYNSPEINSAPLLNLCKQNKAHYRNSADFEDNVFYCGQSQPWMSGVTASHVAMMKENKSYIGSRNMLGVPAGERFDFAVAQPNPLVRQAMIDKVDIMIGLGARFIKEQGKIKTATEVSGDTKVKHSQLATIVDNINDGYNQAFAFASLFMGNTEEVEYKINSKFISPNASAQDIQAMVATFIQGAIPESDYFRWLKQHDLVDPTKGLEEFSEELGNVTELEK